MGSDRANFFSSEKKQALNLASIRSLNDPFEFSNSCSAFRLMNAKQANRQDSDEASPRKEDVRKKIDTCLNKLGLPPIKGELVNPQIQYHYLDGRGGVNSPQKLIDDILKKRDVGVLSMSADRNDDDPIIENPLMWAHYCKSFSGFAIALDPRDDFFSAKKEPDLCVLKKVDYQPSMPLLEDLPQLTENEIILKAGTVKSHHWAYENEWRLITTGNDGLHITDKARLKKLPITAIKGIYLGIKSNEYADNAIKFCKDYEIPIYSMQIRKDNWGINFLNI